jgi:ribosomal protein S18 acetylase RimI-like enzyme
MPPEVALHRASPADLGAYSDISRNTFADTYRASHPAEALARHVASRMNDDALREELADPARHALALTRAGAWLGYALVRHGNRSAVVHGTHPLEIERFYVTRDWQGRGLADSLMNAVLAAARTGGATVAWLGVWEQNSRAVRFYTKCGFAVVGRATYVFDGQAENDLVMSMAL